MAFDNLRNSVRGHSQVRVKGCFDRPTGDLVLPCAPREVAKDSRSDWEGFGGRLWAKRPNWSVKSKRIRLSRKSGHGRRTFPGEEVQPAEESSGEGREAVVIGDLGTSR